MSQGALLTPGPSIHQRPMATGKDLPRRGPQDNGGGSSTPGQGHWAFIKGPKRNTPRGVVPKPGGFSEPKRQGHWPSIHPSIRGLSQLLRLEIPRAGLSGGNRFREGPGRGCTSRVPHTHPAPGRRRHPRPPGSGPSACPSYCQAPTSPGTP